MRIKEGRPKAGGLHVSRPIKAGGVDVSRPIKAGGLEWPFAGLNGRRSTNEGRPFKGRQLIFFSASFDVFFACEREKSLQVD